MSKQGIPPIKFLLIRSTMYFIMIFLLTLIKLLESLESMKLIKLLSFTVTLNIYNHIHNSHKFQYFWGKVPFSNQSTAIKHCFLAYDWLKFGSLRQKYRTLSIFLYSTLDSSLLARRCLDCRAQRGPLGVLPKAKRPRGAFNMKHFGRNVRQVLYYKYNSSI